MPKEVTAKNAVIPDSVTVPVPDDIINAEDTEAVAQALMNLARYVKENTWKKDEDLPIPEAVKYHTLTTEVTGQTSASPGQRSDFLTDNIIIPAGASKALLKEISIYLKRGPIGEAQITDNESNIIAMPFDSLRQFDPPIELSLFNVESDGNTIKVCNLSLRVQNNGNFTENYRNTRLIVSARIEFS